MNNYAPGSTAADYESWSSREEAPARSEWCLKCRRWTCERCGECSECKCDEAE